MVGGREGGGWVKGGVVGGWEGGRWVDGWEGVGGWVGGWVGGRVEGRWVGGWWVVDESYPRIKYVDMRPTQMVG